MPVKTIDAPPDTFQATRSAIDSPPNIDYYYDSHLTEDDLMGESTSQDLPVRYLIEVLLRMYQAQACFVARNLQIFLTNDSQETPISPDIAVFHDFTLPDPEKEDIKSWRVGPFHRLAPNVVIELASTKTKSIDLDQKPEKYARMGVAEYFSYDARPEAEAGTVRLRGWYTQDGAPVEMSQSERGWLWSAELESWLAPDGPYLRLCDRNFEVRPTGEEAERAAKEKERAEKLRERAAKQKERAAKQKERAAKDKERAAKEKERALREKAWAKLREIGIDPTKIE